jgi:cell division protein FtsL
MCWAILAIMAICIVYASMVIWELRHENTYIADRLNAVESELKDIKDKIILQGFSDKAAMEWRKDKKASYEVTDCDLQ